jgi:GH18 family chitinase
VLRPNFTLSIAVGATPWAANQYYKNISQIVQYVDYVNLMTYELQGIWNPWTGMHTELYAG